MDVVVAPFRAEHAGEVLGWVRSQRELEHRCGRSDHPVRDPAVFDDWHRDPDVRPCVLLSAGRPRAYGELWLEPAEGEVELGRLLVAADLRRRGLGRRLIEELIALAASTGGAHRAWVRVVPENEVALRCYEAAGFRRADAARERELNEPQPRSYVWMCRAPV